MEALKLRRDLFDIDYLSSVIRADDILNLWMNHLQELYVVILEDVDLDPLTKIFPIDSHCHACGGWGKRPYTLRQICAGCLLLTRLCHNDCLPETGLFSIMSGSYKDTVLGVRISEMKISNFIEFPDSKKMAQNLIENVPETNYGKIINSTFVGSSNHSDNYTVISSILYCDMLKYKIPCLPTYLWTYSCSNKSFILDFKTNLSVGNLTSLIVDNNIKINIVISLIKQLIIINDFNSHYGFIHGDACLSNLAFETGTKDFFTYKDCVIKTPVVLRFIPSTYSSMTITTKKRQVRFFHTESSYLFGRLDSNPIEEMIPYFSSHKESCVPEKTSVPSLSEIRSCQILGYKIGKRKHIFRHYTRNEGIPLMYSSYEFYSFLIGFLSNPLFFSAFETNPVLMDFWRGLWKPREFSTISKELETIQKMNKIMSSQEILSFLSQYTLRTDLLSYSMYILNKL